jgi:hypothetical protein
VVLFIGVSTQGRRGQGLLQLSRSQQTQPIKDMGDRSKGIKHGLNGILIGYELEVRFSSGSWRVGSSPLGGGASGGLSWAAGRFAHEWAGQLRLGRAGVGEGNSCWVELGFQPGFGP